MSVPALFDLAVLGLVALAAAVYLVALIHRPDVAIWSLVGISVFTEGLRDEVALSIEVGAMRVGALDIAVVVLGSLAASRMIVRRFSGALVPAALLGLVVLHLLRGVDVHGFQSAVNGSRSWLYFAVAFAFAVTLDQTWHRDAFRALAVGGVGLAIFGLYTVSRSGVAVAGSTFWDGTEWVDARAITAAGGVLILSALLVLLTTSSFSLPVRAGGATICAAALVLVPHRTVWVAALVAMLVLFVGWSRTHLRLNREMVYGLTGVVFLFTPIALWALTQSALVKGSVATASGAGSTFAWRTDSWRELLGRHDTAFHALLGSPAGADWTRLVGDTTTALAPHNSYVESYLRFGLPGVVVVAALVLLALFGARANRLAAPSYALAALAVVHLLYGVTYQFAMVCGLVLGVVAQAALERQRETNLQIARQSWHPVG